MAHRRRSPAPTNGPHFGVLGVEPAHCKAAQFLDACPGDLLQPSDEPERVRSGNPAGDSLSSL